MEKIEKAIHHLLKNKIFYANFFLNSKIIYDRPGVPTAMASIENYTTTLSFNKEFVERFSPEKIAGLVEHEILHLLFEHVQEWSYDGIANYDAEIANIAQDLSINQFIEHLPDGGVTIPMIEKVLGKPLEPRQHWEHYYPLLMEKKDELKQKFGTLDKHVILNKKDLDKMTPDQRKAVIRAAIDKAIKGAAGNVPGEVLQIFQALSIKNQLPWVQIVKNFIATHINSFTKYTRKKYNRRSDDINYPGKIKKRELIVGVCTDSSGSVSDEQFQKFMAESVEISQHVTKMYWVDADCMVQNVKEIKKGEKFAFERRGYGGTAYQPAIDKCMELKCDLIIYFGDFDTADKPQDPGVPFIWVGVGSSPKPADFGFEVRLT